MRGGSYIEACKRIIEQVDDAEREALWRVPRSDGRPHGDVTVGTSGICTYSRSSCEFLNVYPDIALRLFSVTAS